MSAPPVYDVRACSARCGYDASYQPPEIRLCPTCGAILVAVPSDLMQAWESGIDLEEQHAG